MAFSWLLLLHLHEDVKQLLCMQVREGLHYNPYFPAGAIAMPKMLADEGTEYEDGTVATEAQQAKVISHSCPCTLFLLPCSTLTVSIEVSISLPQHKWATGCKDGFFDLAGCHHIPGMGCGARA